MSSGPLHGCNSGWDKRRLRISRKRERMLCFNSRRNCLKSAPTFSEALSTDPSSKQFRTHDEDLASRHEQGMITKAVAGIRTALNIDSRLPSSFTRIKAMSQARQRGASRPVRARVELPKVHAFCFLNNSGQGESPPMHDCLTHITR